MEPSLRTLRLNVRDSADPFNPVSLELVLDAQEALHDLGVGQKVRRLRMVQAKDEHFGDPPAKVMVSETQMADQEAQLVLRLIAGGVSDGKVPEMFALGVVHVEAAEVLGVQVQLAVRAMVRGGAVVGDLAQDVLDGWLELVRDLVQIHHEGLSSDDLRDAENGVVEGRRVVGVAGRVVVLEPGNQVDETSAQVDLAEVGHCSEVTFAHDVVEISEIGS